MYSLKIFLLKLYIKIMYALYNTQCNDEIYVTLTR